MSSPGHWLLSSHSSFKTQIKDNRPPQKIPLRNTTPPFFSPSDRGNYSTGPCTSIITVYLHLQNNCGDLSTGLGFVFLFLLQDLAQYLAHLSRALNTCWVSRCLIFPKAFTVMAMWQELKHSETGTCLLRGTVVGIHLTQLHKLRMKTQDRCCLSILRAIMNFTETKCFTPSFFALQKSDKEVLVTREKYFITLKEKS